MPTRATSVPLALFTPNRVARQELRGFRCNGDLGAAATNRATRAPTPAATGLTRADQCELCPAGASVCDQFPQDDPVLRRCVLCQQGGQRTSCAVQASSRMNPVKQVQECTWFLHKVGTCLTRALRALLNATGLSLESQCQDVAKGEWAPIGSAVPEPCPSSGFFCPGRAWRRQQGAGLVADCDPPGDTTKEVEVVETEMELDVDCADFDMDAVKALAADGVNKALITMRTLAWHCVRMRSPGSRSPSASRPQA